MLIDEGLKRNLIQSTDEIYVRNQILSLLQLDKFDLRKEHLNDGCLTEQTDAPDLVIPNLLDEIIQYAVNQKVIENFLDAKEIFSAKIMNCFIARPSVINDTFQKKYLQSPKEATDYFYRLSKNSNYIQMGRISKNIQYKVPTEFGELDITINLSKPEKDPEQIAKERTAPKTNGYPKCALCKENEGYVGRIGHAARSNHRMIKLNIQDEIWFFQYSPYVYYNEHCIVLSEQHRNMEITKRTFARLLDFVDMFPSYFLGSNADLPIVGGSILSHDHYQGGRYEFAMAKAQTERSISFNRYPNVSCSIVKWPMSVLRLSSEHKNELIDLSHFILSQWKLYSDRDVDICAFSGETPHNTITPIARMRNGQYEIDLVLRNNRTSKDYPLGIFHPHSDVQHIKKENIGLIEVMGLAVLPARLKDELIEVEKYLLKRPNQIAEYHVPWAKQLAEKYSFVNEEHVKEIIKEEVGNKFLTVLSHAAVFKRDRKGRLAFYRFIESLDGKIH